MAEQHPAHSAAFRDRKIRAAFLSRTCLIFAVLLAFVFAAPVSSTLAQNAPAGTSAKKSPKKTHAAPAPRKKSAPSRAGTGQKKQPAAQKASTCRLQLGAAAGEIRCISPAQLPFAFSRAQKKMAQLKANPVRACWRQPWEKLRNEFISIYQSKTNGPLAPQALRSAADCQKHLAACSHLGEDYRLAVKIYEAVSAEYPKNRLASQSLYDAYVIADSNLKDSAMASRLSSRIRKQYPSSSAAQKLGSSAKDSAADSGTSVKNAKPELENLSWDTISRDEMEIVLSFSAPAKTSARLGARKASGATLEIDIFSSGVVSEIRRGVAIRGSLLRNISVKTRSAKHTVVSLDFSALRHYSTTTQKGGRELVIRVDNLAKSRNGGVQNGGKAFAGGAREGKLAELAAMADPGLSTVTIDAGHGGSDPGTVHNGIREKNITLDIALRLGTLLRNNGLRVIYTRRSDTGVSLAQRSAKANENQSDLFVSIHVNSHPSSAASGVETYYFDRTSAQDAAKVVSRENGRPLRIQKVDLTGRVLESRRLASFVHRRCVSRVRASGFAVSGHGVKGAPFYVLSTTKMPAILAEVGYCTNRAEADLLDRPAYRQALAAGIAEGILAYSASRSGRITAENSGRRAIR